MHRKFGVAVGGGQGLRIDVGSFRAQLSRRSADALECSTQAAAQAHGQRLRDALEPLMLGDLSSAAARVHSVQVPDLASEENQARAAELLQREGLVMVPKFANAELVERIAARVRRVLDQYAPAIAAGRDAEDDQVVVDATGSRFKTYNELASCPKTVLNIRNLAGGTDSGMIDIFNFDRSSPDDGREMRELLGAGQVRELLQRTTGDEWMPRNFNVYVNRGITKTRGFHVDSYGGHQIKVFLYLTDVKTIEDGPYCYVMGSHRDQELHAINRMLAASFRLKASTDQLMVDPARVVPLLAERGSLIVSQQSGAHRGIPQSPGAERIMAVMNFVGDP
jgi:hypothetical protein